MAGADGAPVHVWVTVVRHWQDNLADLPLTTVNVTWWNAMRVGCAQERNRSRGAGEVIFSHTCVSTSGETGKQRVLHSLHLRSDVCMVSIWSGRHLAQITVNLVDPASSHMLVSKIKPCMSQHKRFTARLQMAH